MNKQLLNTTSILCLSLLASVANAIPVLQLGPDVLDLSDPSTSTDANYVAGGDDTWYLSNDGSSFSFNAYNTGETSLTAYLAFAAVPKLLNESTNYFNLDVSHDGGASVLSVKEEGVGSPPGVDSNGLASHGIFETYYEVYEFTFDNTALIGNTEPNGLGGATPVDGYYETFNVDITFLNPEVTGIHVDLFTLDGIWDENTNVSKQSLDKFAPFSHDVQADLTAVPVPASVWLFGSGLLGLVGVARRKI